jgi:Ca-activated chloride channel family protein
VDQVFHNPSPYRLEGQYLFLLPRNATVSEFALYIDGKKVEGELLEKEKAKGIYEGIVRRMQDPALLEYIGSNVFQARIFPIEPNSDRRIEMTYQAVLAKDFSLVKYTYPLHTPTQISRPIDDFVITVDVKSKMVLKNVYSPTHTVATARKGDNQAIVSFEGKGVAPDHDFALYWAEDDKDVGINFLTYRPDPDEDGYFLALLSPRPTSKKEDVQPKDIVFVLDTSGSMTTDDRMKQAKKALQHCVRSLDRNDRFNIVTFATETSIWNDGLLEATDKNVDKAAGWIDTDIRAAGGTNINDALVEALKLQPPERNRPFLVCFITDGEPTVGTTDPKEIVANVKNANVSSVRIFSLGIGEELNAKLVDEIAASTNAVSEYIKPKEDIELKVSNFFTRISSPVMTNLDLKFGTVKVAEVYPKKMADLFRGSQMTVLGRYKTHGATAIELAGMMAGKPVKLAYDVKFPESSSENDFLPRIWATRKVAYLLEEIRLHGENAELKDEVIKIARKFAIVTPYTSYLVVEDTMQAAPPPAPVRGRWGDRDDGRVFGPGASSRGGGGGDMLEGKREEREINLDAAAPAAAPMEAFKSSSGAGAIRMSEKLAKMKDARPADEESSAGRAGSGIRKVGPRTFLMRGGKWVDTAKADEKPALVVKYGSEAYFAVVAKYTDLARCAALGKNVEVMFRGKLVVFAESEGVEKIDDAEMTKALGAN